jgi:site-specific DNA recombinase
MQMTPKKTRAAIYARYSSDLQNDRSCDDQFHMARSYAERDGLQVVATFADRARSGASFLDRDGLLDLMQAAKLGRFDVLLVESLDRLSRDQEDLAGLFKRLNFFNVEIRTLNEGVATSVHVGLRGLVGQLFLADLGQKVRRGHVGRVRDGKIPGSIAYGYRRIAGKPGEVEIDPEASAIVRRIFTEYASGKSPKLIAVDLTADGVPAPRGGAWTHHAFVGGRGKGQKKGFVSNRIYVGELHWNRLRSVRNPETGRVIKRAAPEADHVFVDMPHLRIIDDELWGAAHRVLEGRSARANGIGRHPAVRSRSTSLLAGILYCGRCEAPMWVGQNSRNGNGRMVCREAYLRSACEHSKSYDVSQLERVVLAGLTEQLADEALMARFVAAYRDERRKLERAARSDSASIKRRLSEIEAAQFRLVNALEAGKTPEALIIPRLQALEAERAALSERERLAKHETNVIDLHPQAVARYREAVLTLQTNLSQPIASVEARLAFRNLVERVVVIPTPKRAPYEVALHGRLAALMGIDLSPPARRARDIAAEQGVICSDEVPSEKSVSS